MLLNKQIKQKFYKQYFPKQLENIVSDFENNDINNIFEV